MDHHDAGARTESGQNDVRVLAWVVLLLRMPWVSAGDAQYTVTAINILSAGDAQLHRSHVPHVHYQEIPAVKASFSTIAGVETAPDVRPPLVALDSQVSASAPRVCPPVSANSSPSLPPRVTG